MGYYLLDNPNPAAPERGDGRYWGYMEMSAAPRAVTVHTTESLADVIGSDAGAENVAHASIEGASWSSWSFYERIYASGGRT